MKLDSISITTEELDTKSEKLMLGSHMVASVSQASRSPCRGPQEASLGSAQSVQAQGLVHGAAVLTSLAIVLPLCPPTAPRLSLWGCRALCLSGLENWVMFSFRSRCSLPET